MTKKLMAGLVLMFSTLMAVFANDVTLSSTISDKYVGFGSGDRYSDDTVLQSDFNVALENGFYFDLWNSTGIEKARWNDGFDDEVDYGIGWSGDIGKGFSLDIGISYFDEPDIGTFGTDDMWWTHVKVSHELDVSNVGISPITVFGLYENYKPLPVNDYDGGNLFSVGVSASQETYENLTVDVSQALTYDDGGFGLDKGLLAKWMLGFKWKVSDKLTMTLPQVNAYLPLTVEDERDTEFVFTSGLSYSL